MKLVRVFELDERGRVSGVIADGGYLEERLTRIPSALADWLWVRDWHWHRQPWELAEAELFLQTSATGEALSEPEALDRLRRSYPDPYALRSEPPLRMFIDFERWDDDDDDVVFEWRHMFTYRSQVRLEDGTRIPKFPRDAISEKQSGSTESPMDFIYRKLIVDGW